MKRAQPRFITFT